MLKKIIEESIKELLTNEENNNSDSYHWVIGNKCIIRTYSAGVWFGKVSKKDGNEIYLKNARRINYFKVKSGISLSSVANNGLHEDSKVAEPVDIIWLQPIEIIPCTQVAIDSIEKIKTDEA